MKKKLNVLLTVFLVGIVAVLAGCSGKEIVYKSGDEEVRISGNKQIEHRVNLTTLSYLTQTHGIKEESDGHYITDTSTGLNWQYTIHKDDPAYEELMEELDYFVNTRGFDLKEESSTIIASGEVDEDMQSEFGIHFDENYNELEFTDPGLILNDSEFTKAE